MNSELKASELTKLEYALIHSTWRPSEDDIKAVFERERRLNPHNDSYKPKLHSHKEIMHNLRLIYFRDILNNTSIF